MLPSISQKSFWYELSHHVQGFGCLSNSLLPMKKRSSWKKDGWPANGFERKANANSKRRQKWLVNLRPLTYPPRNYQLVSLNKALLNLWTMSQPCHPNRTAAPSKSQYRSTSPGEKSRHQEFTPPLKNVSLWESEIDMNNYKQLYRKIGWSNLFFMMLILWSEPWQYAVCLNVM